MHKLFTGRKLIGGAVAIALGFTLAGCSTSSSETASPTGEDSQQILKVGALAVPAGELLEWVNDTLAEEAGVQIEWVEFTDYNTPNTALSDGDIDANLFQNTTFLENFNSATGSDLISLGEIYLPVAAFYSNDVTNISDLEDGAKIAIPDDPTNEGRALEMLSAEGLIETTENPSQLSDVTSNPHNFDFIEIENASLPTVLPDVDAAFVTISFALPAGLNIADAILVEGQSSKYFNVLATRPDLKTDPGVNALLELLRADETQEYMLETFGDQIVPVAK